MGETTPWSIVTEFSVAENDTEAPLDSEDILQSVEELELPFADEKFVYTVATTADSTDVESDATQSNHDILNVIAEVNQVPMLEVVLPATEDVSTAEPAAAEDVDLIMTDWGSLSFGDLAESAAITVEATEGDSASIDNSLAAGALLAVSPALMRRRRSRKEQ